MPIDRLLLRAYTAYSSVVKLLIFVVRDSDGERQLQVSLRQSPSMDQLEVLRTQLLAGRVPWIRRVLHACLTVPYREC